MTLESSLHMEPDRTTVLASSLNVERFQSEEDRESFTNQIFCLETLVTPLSGSSPQPSTQL